MSLALTGAVEDLNVWDLPTLQQLGQELARRRKHREGCLELRKEEACWSERERQIFLGRLILEPRGYVDMSSSLIRAWKMSLRVGVRGWRVLYTEQIFESIGTF